MKRHLPYRAGQKPPPQTRTPHSPQRDVSSALHSESRTCCGGGPWPLAVPLSLFSLPRAPPTHPAIARHAFDYRLPRWPQLSGYDLSTALSPLPWSPLAGRGRRGHWWIKTNLYLSKLTLLRQAFSYHATWGGGGRRRYKSGQTPARWHWTKISKNKQAMSDACYFPYLHKQVVHSEELHLFKVIKAHLLFLILFVRFW